MNKAALLILALLGAVLVFASACGGDEAAAVPTSIPTAAAEPTAAAAPTDTPTPKEPAGAAMAGALEISSVGEALQFDKNMLKATAGAEVVVKLSNKSITLEHNWVLVQAGTKDDVATAATLAGPAVGWIPPDDDRIFANTSLLKPGTTGEVRFTPPAAGTYEFVCTFPGHNVTMFGTFEVTS